MAEYYPAGYQIPLVNGSDAVIVKKLGEGGQGVVYRVSVGGREYALKWYHKGAVHNPKKFYQNLESNISKGAPTKAFLWPLYLTKPVDGRICGRRISGSFRTSCWQRYIFSPCPQQ